MKTLMTTLFVGSALISSIGTAASVDDIRTYTPQTGLQFNPVVIDDLIPVPPSEPDAIRFTSRNHFYKQAITSTKPRITNSEKFITVPGTLSKVVIPAGKNALVNLAFTAESRCNEINSTAPDWCEVRILVNGVEASPQASSFPNDTYAFDSTDSGTETGSSWESHAMDRHHCIFNSKSNTNLAVPVEVQWKVTNFDGGNAPSFWLDDWSFTIELAEGCRREKLTVDES